MITRKQAGLYLALLLIGAVVVVGVVFAVTNQVVEENPDEETVETKDEEEAESTLVSQSNRPAAPELPHSALTI